MSNVRVSCIVPSFNRPKFIKHCIYLFNQQTWPNKEIIIVDDSSKPYNLKESDSLKYIRLTKKVSIGEKRNIATKAATGSIVIFWDDDDWYGKTRIQKQVQPILNNNVDMTMLKNFRYFRLCDGKVYETSKKLTDRLFEGTDGFHGGTLCFRKKIFSDGVRFPKKSIAEDAIFYIRATNRGYKTKAINAKGLFLYVRHKNTYDFNLDSRWKKVNAESKMSSKSRVFYKTFKK